MKHGKRPTAGQRKRMEKWKLNAGDWLIVKDTPEEMVLVHRNFEKVTRRIPKGGGDGGKTGRDALL